MPCRSRLAALTPVALLSIVAACAPAHDRGDDETGGDAGATADAGLGGPDAGASAKLRVFVTSQRYPADLRSAGGLDTGRESANALCQLAADAAELGGTFRAWISVSNVDAIDQVEGDGPWYRMDGVMLFPNHASLGTVPDEPILLDENGEMPDPFFEAWTGTAIGGRLATGPGLDSATCLDWTSTIDSESIKGLVGDIDGDGAAWTNLADGYCSPFERRLYCFEQ
jgi:hypothetical protein